MNQGLKKRGRDICTIRNFCTYFMKSYGLRI